MKKIFPFLLIVIASSSLAVASELLKLDKLKLKTGREFDKVTVTEKRPDGISIAHESGTARIKFEDLPEDVAAKLGGFDNVAAAKSRAEQDKASRQQEKAYEKALQAADDEVAKKAYAKMIENAAKPAVIKVVQAANGGALCKIAFYVETREEHSSKDAFGRNVTSYTKGQGLGPFSDELNFVENVEAVDDAQYTASILACGTFHYTTILGAAATVKRWQVVDKK